jgi:D-arabinose 1-dehydrogenase-like Zn-dependent alcohol dehydrogenase
MIVVVLQIMSMVIGGASLLWIIFQLFQKNKKYIVYGIGGIGIAGILLFSSYLYLVLMLKSGLEKYKDKRSPEERKLDSIEGAKKIERNQKEFDSIQKVLQDLQKK